MSKAYRPCVLAVFVNEAGLVMIAERADRAGSWQFPQGGVDDGESAHAAVRREMEEELGSSGFEVVEVSKTPVRYTFPDGLGTKIAERWRGQEQTWFRLRWLPGQGPDLEHAPDRELAQIKWVTPQAAVDAVVDFKREAYLEGLASLGFKVK